MQVYILDKEAVPCANKLPDNKKHWMLVELLQLVCTAFNFDETQLYKHTNQGKCYIPWILNNSGWVYSYCLQLYEYINQPSDKLTNIMREFNKVKGSYSPLQTGIFRYTKGYTCDIPTNTELPIKECINRYNKYRQFKGF